MAESTQKGPAKSARKVAEDLRDMSAEATRAASDTAKSFASEAKERGQALAEEAKERGETYRAAAAEEAGRLTGALRRASKDLDDGSPQGRFVGQLAEGVADAADRVRGMSLDDLARDATDFAKRHPGAFLGGAALLGFAVARLMRSSARSEPQAYLPAGEPDRRRES